MKNKNENIKPKVVLTRSLPIIGAIFLAVVSILYILYKSWDNKLYLEKWKDYEDCGV